MKYYVFNKRLEIDKKKTSLPLRRRAGERQQNQCTCVSGKNPGKASGRRLRAADTIGALLWFATLTSKGNCVPSVTATNQIPEAAPSVSLHIVSKSTPKNEFWNNVGHFGINVAIVFKISLTDFADCQLGPQLVNLIKKRERKEWKK